MIDLTTMQKPSALLIEGLRCLQLLRKDPLYVITDHAVHEHSAGACLINCTGAMLAVNTSASYLDTIDPEGLPDMVALNCTTLQWTLLGYLVVPQENRITDSPIFPTATLSTGLDFYLASMTGVAISLDKNGY